MIFEETEELIEALPIPDELIEEVADAAAERSGGIARTTDR